MTKISITVFMVLGILCAVSTIFNPINLLISIMSFTMVYVIKKEQIK